MHLKNSQNREYHVQCRTALFIFTRRLRVESGKLTLAYVERLQENQKHLEELESVVFLHDCYKRALQKATRAWTFESKINPKWKDYDKFVALIPLIKEHRVNPFSFFLFKIEDFRQKRIVPKMANIVTKKAMDHYLHWRRQNQYRVAISAKEKTYCQEWMNQLSIDLQALVAYELRRPVIALTNSDDFLFSGLGKSFLNHFHRMKFPVDEVDQKQWNELLENKSLLSSLVSHWNGALEVEKSKLFGLRHSLRDQNFLKKLDDITNMLSVLNTPAS